MKLFPQLQKQQFSWLVTGAAGFIGSNLVEYLLRQNQKVIGIDNFYSGKKENLRSIEKNVGAHYRNFQFREGDIRDKNFCNSVMKNIDFVLHHAAFVSVPRSIAEPDVCFDINIRGTHNLLSSADVSGVKRFIYASSSAVYGDGQEQEKTEHLLLRPQSPYAESKVQNEKDAKAAVHSQMKTVGFRYFNVFGPRQDPGSPYSGVIAIWMNGLRQQKQNFIYGDGTITRDFCPVESVIMANVAACFADLQTQHSVLNVGTGQSVTLKEMYQLLESEFQKLNPQISVLPVQFKNFRQGDILHSKASIENARQVLDFHPQIDLQGFIQKLFLSESLQ